MAKITVNANDTVTFNNSALDVLLDNGFARFDGMDTINILDATSTGRLAIGNGTLEIGASSGSGATIQFIGADRMGNGLGTLQIDNPTTYWGHNVTAPLVPGGIPHDSDLITAFRVGDQIDLKGFAFDSTWSRVSYNATTGQALITHGNGAAVVLQLDQGMTPAFTAYGNTAVLQLHDDYHGGTVIVHS